MSFAPRKGRACSDEASSACRRPAAFQSSAQRLPATNQLCGGSWYGCELSAPQRRAAHARAHLVGDLLSSADAARKKLSRVVARRSRDRREGRRQQALDNRGSSGQIADAAGNVESCSACPGGQLLLTHALDAELVAAVDHS
eukprot:3912234-Pleurochrysis_carterae.AAC.1